jgi:hypothetical protein
VCILIIFGGGVDLDLNLDLSGYLNIHVKYIAPPVALRRGADAVFVAAPAAPATCDLPIASASGTATCPLPTKEKEKENEKVLSA